MFVNRVDAQSYDRVSGGSVFLLWPSSGRNGKDLRKKGKRFKVCVVLGGKQSFGQAEK